MPVWLSPLFSALSQPVLSFFHLCQTNKSPALFVDFELCDAVVVGCFCGFCFDFFFVGFVHGGGGRVFLWWWGGLLPWVWGGLLPWVFRYEVVGSTVMVGVAAVRWVVVDNTYTTVYIHTLLLIYATYWYCFSLMCLLVLHTHICMLPFLLTWTRSTHTNTIAYTVWPC